MTGFICEDSVLVTIGMPVYNGAETIACALESLLAQTYSNFELVISDNASTDDTMGICRGYAERDPRVKYFRNDENIGAVANFNRLLEMGEGSLFMWAAHDDSWEPDFIAELVYLLERDSSAVLAFCHFDLFDNICDYRADGPSLLPLARPVTPFARLARFLLMPEGRYKSVMIYGLFRVGDLRAVRGMYSGFDGLDWSLDNHTLFLLGLRGKFAMSDRLLHHRGIKSGVDSTLQTWNEIFKNYSAYKEHISESSLSLPKRSVLQVFAFFNSARSLAENLVARALIRGKHIPLVSRLYREWRLYRKSHP